MRDKNPIAGVVWRDPRELTANDYNPNRVFLPELELLRLSLLEDLWTQPIVVTESSVIVDGFHRWTLALRDPAVLAIGDGAVPTVVLQGKGDAARMAATVRHNRARGQHGILRMGSIVRALLAELPRPRVLEVLGMEEEELLRLEDVRTSPEKAGVDAFGRGWVPIDSPADGGKKRRRKP